MTEPPRADESAPERPVVVIEPGRAYITAAPDEGGWEAFLTDTVGNEPDTGYTFPESGRAYYCNSDVARPAGPGPFNPAATLLAAGDARTPLHESPGLFGTVVITGFDQSWQPVPLTAAQLEAAIADLADGAAFARTVTGAPETT